MAARRLVLASASPRRRQLLQRLCLPFEVDASDVPEDLEPGADVEAAVVELALAKAREVATRHTDALVIAADTLVTMDDRVYGKPGDMDDARRMLSELSGACHRVVTGLVLLDAATGAARTHIERTGVYFRRLPAAEIEAYIQTPEPYDKAGAYAIQGLAAAFIDHIEGDYDNVVGLPVLALRGLLQDAGVHLPGSVAVQSTEYRVQADEP